ncbi:MAG: divergent polysaccharide deacetylase family protein [Spirochaetia bacterium]|nr:divergent polysaccharide deacetylase family protein [Spirochaetia bacterium]
MFNMVIKNKIIKLCILFFLSGFLIFNFAEDTEEEININNIPDDIKNDLNINNIAEEISKLWSDKNCANHITRDFGYIIASLACEGGYAKAERNNFLDLLFSKGFVLKKESYELEKRQGIYLYKMEYPSNSGQFVYFKLYFRNADFLWPRTPLERKIIALYVQDLYQHDDLIMWQTLGVPISYGVLPFRAETSFISDKVREYEQELWMALSLEPLVITPEKGEFLLVKEAHDLEKINTYLDEALQQTGKIKGISNRMGSRFMTETYLVRHLFSQMKEKEINYFLDTWTNQDSVGYETAAIMQLKSYRRDIILDHKISSQNLIKHWEWFEKRFSEKESGIIVVHAANKAAFEFIKEKINKLSETVDFVWVSKLPSLDR